jgi:VIT1/CCC1 family predicted Fe2+/Mn2+ transporter
MFSTQIEKNTLTTFYNIAANKEFVEHEIARRQLAIKDQNSNSWFTHIRKLLQKYSLQACRSD